MNGKTLHIGHVASLAGVNIQTLRYYERRGLLRSPRRSVSGYREYSRDIVRIVRSIRRAQQLGFTLHEIKELIHLRNARRTPADLAVLAKSKMREIDEKIRSLHAMREALRDLIRTCTCHGDPSKCRVLEGLDDGASLSG